MALFIHNKNQELLWNVINKTQIFQLVFMYSTNNEPELWFKAHIQQYYPKIQNRTLSLEDLNACNHEIISIMMNNLKSFADNMGQPLPTSRELPHTVENKQELYSKQFTERQKEYDLMNTKPQPPIPDINDNIKDEAISNMDELIKLHMQQREAELRQYSPMMSMPAPSPTSIPTSIPTPVNIEKPSNIKIASNENIKLLPDEVLDQREGEKEKPKKNVSWSHDKENEDLQKELHKEFDELKQQVLKIGNQFVEFQEEMRNFMKNFTALHNNSNAQSVSFL